MDEQCAGRTRGSPFELLSEDVIVTYIMSVLSARDLVTFGATNTFYHRLSNERNLWKRICTTEMHPSLWPQRRDIVGGPYLKAWYIDQRMPFISLQDMATRIASMPNKSVLLVGRRRSGKFSVMYDILHAPAFEYVEHKEWYDKAWGFEEVQEAISDARNQPKPTAVLCSTQMMTFIPKDLKFCMVLVMRCCVQEKEMPLLFDYAFGKKKGWSMRTLKYWLDRVERYDCLGYEIGGLGPFMMRRQPATGEGTSIRAT